MKKNTQNAVREASGRSLGKGEVGSSILLGSTSTPFNKINGIVQAAKTARQVSYVEKASSSRQTDTRGSTLTDTPDFRGCQHG